MGFLKKISAKLFGTEEDVEVENLERRSTMSDTLIFTGQPDYTSVIASDYSGNGDPISAADIRRLQAEDARINASHPVPGQINNAPARPRGVSASAPQQLPPGVQYGGNYAVPPQNVPVQQQPAYPQQGYPQPVQQVAPQPVPPPQQPQEHYFLEEPFSELVMTDTECHVLVDLPGIPRSDVDVQFTENNEVQITYTRNTFADQLVGDIKSGKTKSKSKSEGKTRGKKEKLQVKKQVNIPDYLLGTHTVVYPIPRPVDDTKVECSFELGQVHVTLGLKVGKKITIA